VLSAFLKASFVPPEQLLPFPEPFVPQVQIPSEWLTIRRGVVTNQTFDFPELNSLDERLKTSFPELFARITYLVQLPDHLRLLIVQLVLEFGEQEINAGNVNLQALLFLMIDLFPSELRREISSLLYRLKSQNVLFNATTFSPKVTLFNDPGNPILSLRLLILRVGKMFLDFPVSGDLIVWLFEFLDHLLEWPELFAEFLFYAKPILSQCRPSAWIFASF
jgi:hypothetical protein